MNAKTNSVIVIPNGYGALNYCDDLKFCFNRRGFNIHMMDLTASANKFHGVTVETAAIELERRIRFLSKNRKCSVTLLVHCSGALPLLHLPDSPMWRSIDGVVLYSYLAQPMQHINRFRQRAARFGVNVDDSYRLKREYGPADYASLPKKLTVIHPMTKRNNARASTEDLQALQESVPDLTMHCPSEGYEISNVPQFRRVEHIVDDYYLNAISC